MNDFRRSAGKCSNRQPLTVETSIHEFALGLIVTRHQKLHIRPIGMNERGGFNERGEISLHLLVTRTGEEADDRSQPVPLAVEKGRSQLLARKLIKVGMADVVSGHAAIAVPRFLEGQGTQDMI